jgi:hypothetical protein
MDSKGRGNGLFPEPHMELISVIVSQQRAHSPVWLAALTAGLEAFKSIKPLTLIPRENLQCIDLVD